MAEQPRAKAESLLKKEQLTPYFIWLDAYLNPIVKKFLRFNSHQLNYRRAFEDTLTLGVAIAAGSLSSLCTGAANRNPANFGQSNLLLLERQNNRHLAFSLEIHQCVGMSLARLECRIAISRLLQRLPNYRLLDTPT